MNLTKKRTKAVSIKGIVPILPISCVVLLSGALLLYLSPGKRCEDLGKELKVLDSEIADLKRKCENEEDRWMRLKSPGELEKLLRRWNLQMTWPDDQKIVRLTQADAAVALEPAWRARRPQYAQIGRVVSHD
ncbi:MAG: hypothetical protein WCN95_04120 [bacterium]